MGCSCCRSRTPSFADRVAAAPRTRTRVSVEREGAQAAARGIVKRGAHAAAPAPQASLTVSRQPSHAGCGKLWRLRRARRSEEVRPRRRALARATAIRRAHGPLRCTASQVRRCAGPPRRRSAPRTRTRASVEREGAQKAAFDSMEWSLCGCSRKRGLGLTGRSRATTFVARLATIRILPATRLTKDLIRGSIRKDKDEHKTSGDCGLS
jgi:hypothetical protein